MPFSSRHLQDVLAPFDYSALRWLSQPHTGRLVGLPGSASRSLSVARTVRARVQRYAAQYGRRRAPLRLVARAAAAGAGRHCPRSWSPASTLSRGRTESRVTGNLIQKLGSGYPGDGHGPPVPGSGRTESPATRHCNTPS